MRRLLLLLPLVLLAACNGNGDAVYQGYVEGDFVDVAPEVGGRIVERAVARGDVVKAGDLLFRIDDATAIAAVAQSTAQKSNAEAQLANLREGKRPPEIAVIDAQIAQARAVLEKARSDFDRQKALFDRRVVSQADLDQAREAITVAEAQVSVAERQKDVAALPARVPEIEAAEHTVAAAGAALDQAQTALAKYAINAPVDGRVEDTYYEKGEVATTGAPVLQLLPADKRKIVFFVPEAARPGFAAGTPVAVACDGCPSGLSGTVTFLAADAEYTPPVIFSRERREKLVFRVEAALSGAAMSLPLGQPVDVSRQAGGAS